MTEDAFRQLALSFPGTMESAHMDHPDFRAAGKVFASLGYPDDGWGMVKLTPEQQRDFLEEAPEDFVPCAGAWGRGGATNVRLESAQPKLVKSAMKLAVDNLLAKARPKANRKGA